MPELEDDVEAVEEVEAAKNAEGASCAYCGIADAKHGHALDFCAIVINLTRATTFFIFFRLNALQSYNQQIELPNFLRPSMSHVLNRMQFKDITI